MMKDEVLLSSRLKPVSRYICVRIFTKVASERYAN